MGVTVRQIARGIEARVSEHCGLAGIAPPPAVVRRYAVVRAIESRWWLRGRLSVEALELAEEFGVRMGLCTPAAGSPLIWPDLLLALRESAPPCTAYAEWPDAGPLPVGLLELRGGEPA